MPRARILMLIGAGVGLVACAETTAPPQPTRGATTPDRQLHMLAWQGTPASWQFAVSKGGSNISQTTIASAPSVLDTYELDFWAYRDVDGTAQINYLASDGSWQPFVSLFIPRDALFALPDGSPIFRGDSVLITMTVDPQALVVQLEPTGLVFNTQRPAQISIRYSGANPDYNGDGSVNEGDGQIEQNLLGVWVQEGPGSPWSSVTATHSLLQKLFTADLQHFSGYAVSW